MTNLKQQLKGLVKQLLPYLVWAIVLGGVVAYLKSNYDVHLFAITHPEQVRKAMAINRLGDVKKGEFIMKVYGDSFASPIAK